MICVAIYTYEGSAGWGSTDIEQFESIAAAQAAHPGHDVQQLRVCTKCKHAECPHCPQGSCDTVIGLGEGNDSEGYEDFDVCCGGRCTYVEPKPFEIIKAVSA